jgi:rhodanese-related sulfurtransferase
MELARDAEIITYCGGPKCPQSMLAAQKLVELGYTNVKAYEGGLEEWKAAGHEVVRLEQGAAA